MALIEDTPNISSFLHKKQPSEQSKNLDLKLYELRKSISTSFDIKLKEVEKEQNNITEKIKLVDVSAINIFNYTIPSLHEVQQTTLKFERFNTLQKQVQDITSELTACFKLIDLINRNTKKSENKMGYTKYKNKQKYETLYLAYRKYILKEENTLSSSRFRLSNTIYSSSSIDPPFSQFDRGSENFAKKEQRTNSVSLNLTNVDSRATSRHEDNTIVPSRYSASALNYIRDRFTLNSWLENKEESEPKNIKKSQSNRKDTHK